MSQTKWLRSTRSAASQVGLWILAAFFLSASIASNDLSLDQALERIDRRSQQLTTLQATIEVKNWTHLLEEFDGGERGRIALRKTREQTYFRHEIEEPQSKILVVKDGEAVLYRPRIKQAVVYSFQKSRKDSSNLFLSFLAGREAMNRDFETSLREREEVGGVNAYVLELVPKDPATRSQFTKLLFWFHPELWVPVRQEIVQLTKDFQRIDFAEIRINDAVSAKEFDLKLPKDVQIKTL